MAISCLELSPESGVKGQWEFIHFCHDAKALVDVLLQRALVTWP